MTTSKPPTEATTQEPSNEVEVVKAFYARDFTTVSQLCAEILRDDADNAFAQAFLTQLGEMRQQGYTLPLSLRRELHNAIRLAQLRQFEDARGVYETIQKEARRLSLPLDDQYEQMFLDLDALIEADKHYEAGIDAFAEDQWEKALEEYQAASKLAPKQDYITSAINEVSVLVEQVEHIAALQQTTEIQNSRIIDQWAKALYDVHRLNVRFPDSERLVKLTATVEQAVVGLRDKLSQELEEILTLSADSSDRRIVSSLLRRSETLLSYIEQLLGSPEQIEALREDVNLARMQHEVSLEFETQLHTWIQINESSFALGDQDADPGTVLAGIEQALNALANQYQQVNVLRYCYLEAKAALLCGDLNSIVHYAPNYTERPELKNIINLSWLNRWRDARGKLLSISQFLASVPQGSRLDMVQVMAEFDALGELSNGLLLPLRKTCDLIRSRWYSIVAATQQSREGV